MKKKKRKSFFIGKGFPLIIVIVGIFLLFYSFGNGNGIGFGERVVDLTISETVWADGLLFNYVYTMGEPSVSIGVPYQSIVSLPSISSSGTQLFGTKPPNAHVIRLTIKKGSSIVAQSGWAGRNWGGLNFACWHGLLNCERTHIFNVKNLKCNENYQGEFEFFDVDGNPASNSPLSFSINTQCGGI